MVTAVTSMSAQDVAAFADSVRGTLIRHWPDPTAAADADAELRLLWSDAVEHGWFGLAADGALAAALAAVRELGRVSCPLPLLDGYVAGLLFAHDSDVTDRIAAGEIRVVATLRDQEAAPVRHMDAAPAATHLLAIPPTGGQALLLPVLSTCPTPGLAVPAWSEVTTGAAEAATPVDPESADETVVLLRLQLAVRALAAAGRAHEMAVEHAMNRRQFGKVIGSFGAVQQRTADCQIAVASGTLLVDDAIRAFEQNTADRLLTAEIATEHIRTGAPGIQLGAHHTLAAVGYFEEHAAPWLFRRVHGDLARLRDLPRAAGSVCDVLVEGSGSLPAADLGAQGEAFRDEVRALFEQFADRATLHGANLDPDVVGALADRGWLGFAWPKEAGGREATLAEQVVLHEEAAYHRAPVGRALGAVTLLGNSILKHGTEAQKDRFLPLIRRGEMAFCLGYSEPEAGSDLASLRTRAVRDGDGWVINGQKLWTTGGHLSNWVWLAVRTDTDATPRQAGITVFLVPMDTPGITVQQHTSLSGGVSCTVFYDDVRVHDDLRVGEVDGGWRVITDALAGERITMGNIAAALHRQLDDLLAVVRADPDTTVGPRGSARRERLGALAVGVQANRALVASAIRATAAGTGARLEAPMAGVMGGELAEQFGESVLEILGCDAALSAAAAPVTDVPGGGAFEYGLRLSVMYVVGGGTNDIQRGLIARGLGLPR
ncbi:acyl-CoA dehydrogenase family protein [Streptomyces sp. NPDC096311]|uniref:acyl-CoA dehydrogenase family protein n=1 Tax=Streptomyces sp. NPDC096311 TaxID=3366083 RepID=UPI0037F8F1F6